MPNHKYDGLWGQQILAATARAKLVYSTPEIAWSKPLTPCGPESDPTVKLLGTVTILGASFHAEAYAVLDDAEGAQTGVQDESDTWLSEILNIVQGSAQPIRINERDYVLAITPSQR